MNNLKSENTIPSGPNVLSIRIRECLRRSGLTSRDFAAKIGVSPSAITKYIKQNTAPSIVVAHAIATAANVSLHWLATGTEAPPTDQAPTDFITQLRERLKIIVNSVGGAEAFAAALGLDANDVNSWLTSNLPTADQFKIILHRFDCSADELLLGNDARLSWELRNLDMNADPTCRPTDVLGGGPNAAYPVGDMAEVLKIQNWIFEYYQPGKYEFVKVGNTLLEPALMKGDMAILRKSEPHGLEGIFLFSAISATTFIDVQDGEPKQAGIRFFARLRAGADEQFVLSWDNAQGVMVKKRGFNPLQEKIIGRVVAKLTKM